MHLTMTFATFIDQTFNGVALGMLFVIMAVGLTIILGLMRVINFAHGVLYTLGAYTCITLYKYTSFWPCLFIAFGLVGLIGMGLEFSMIRPLYKRDPLYTLLLTFGVAFIITDLVRMVWGDAAYPMSPPALLSGVVSLKIIVYPKYRLFVILFSTGILGALWYFLEKTQLGKTVLAGTFDREMVMSLGIPINRLFTIVFGIGAGLAALAGVLSAPMRGVDPQMGTYIIMPSFVVVIIGGMGSFWGAVIGGIMVGLVTSFTVEIYPPASQVIPYILMAIVLLVRPRGIAGIEGLME